MPRSIAESSRLANLLPGLQVAIPSSLLQFWLAADLTVGGEKKHVVVLRQRMRICSRLLLFNHTLLYYNTFALDLLYCKRWTLSCDLSSTMLESVAKYFSSVSQVRKLLFALVHLPEDLPNRWEIALAFASSTKGVTAEQVRVLCDNLQEIDLEAFATDRSLTSEILQFPRNKPLGVVLISEKKTCQQCGSSLLLRKDRPSSLVIYHDTMGTIHGTHYHRYCTNKRCSYVQFYGYHTFKSGPIQQSVFFDNDWKSHRYFVSSRETAFDMKLLFRFDSQILLGQQSFKQCSDVYNHLHLQLEKHGISEPLMM